MSGSTDGPGAPGSTGAPGGPVASAGAPSAAPHLTGRPLAAVRGVRLLDGTLADLLLDGAVVAAVLPRPAGDALAAGPREGGPTEALDLDARGWRFVPAASEPHAHLDKALTAHRCDPGAGNDLVAAIEQWRALTPGITADDVHARGLDALTRYAAAGTTSVRSHVDVARHGDPLRFLDGLLRLREDVAGSVTLQVCLLAGSETPDAVITEAVARGVDVIGGCPHLAPDPHHETTRMLDVAERTGLPIDLHTDEQTSLDPTPGRHALDVVDLAEQVIARGLTQRVTASHAVRLGSLPAPELAPVLDLLVRAGIGVVALPITNLYLQGWDADHLAPRGLTAVRALLDAGVDLAAGADNLRDPFNPVGRADPFETTSLLVTAGHLRAEEALAAVTTGARTVLGLPPVGAAPGCAADFVLVPDTDLGEVVAGPGDARIVVHGGRVVADTRVARTVDVLGLPRTAPASPPSSASPPSTSPSSTSPPSASPSSSPRGGA